MNISAVLSILNRHDIAINHANQAIILIQSSLLLQHLPSKDKIRKKDQKDDAHDSAMRRDFKDKMVLLTIAYHNLGVE